MGLLDDTLRQLTQGGGSASGSGAPDLAVVIRELLVGKPQPGAQPSAQQQAEVPRGGAGGKDGGAGSGGLADLLDQLQAGGLDEIVKSWVGTEQNKPVQPEDLGEALGRRNVTQMADKVGCSQDDLLTQLAKALPNIIDQLTRDGRVPTQTEVNQRLRG